MRRLFAAIHVMPEPPLLELLSHAEAIFRHEKIRWVNPGNLHLTIKFFGETPEDQIPLIREHLGSAVGRHAPFHFNLKGLGIFGSRYLPRVIWTGTEDDMALLSLAGDLLDASEAAGFPRERLSFVPHLTLGRISHVGDKKHLGNFITAHQDTLFQSVTVARVILFESVLNPSGAVYSEFATFTLSL
jgi:2'-5' RNA ligase